MDGEQPLGGLLAGLEQVVQVGAAVAVRAGGARAALEQRLVGGAEPGLGEVHAPAPPGVRDDAPSRGGRSGSASRSRTCPCRARRRGRGRRPRRSRAGAVGGPRAAPARSTRPRRTSAPCPPPASRRSRCRRPPARPPPGRRRAAGPPPRRPARSRRRPAPPGRGARATPGSGRASGGCARWSAAVYSRDGVERRALVEHERDVRAERRLDLHRRLRAHEPPRAVEIGAERHALLLDRQDRARALAACPGLRGAALDLVGHGAVPHREHLEPARVGDDRPVPAHEAVQPAELADQLVAGRQEQVERVPQHHVVAEVAGLADLQRLDDGLGRERDERGRADLAVGQLERPRPGVRVRRAGADVEAGHGGGEPSHPPPRR